MGTLHLVVQQERQLTGWGPGQRSETLHVNRKSNSEGESEEMCASEASSRDVLHRPARGMA